MIRPISAPIISNSLFIASCHEAAVFIVVVSTFASPILPMNLFGRLFGRKPIPMWTVTPIPRNVSTQSCNVALSEYISIYTSSTTFWRIYSTSLSFPYMTGISGLILSWSISACESFPVPSGIAIAQTSYSL